jgi:hypothetical protein
MSWRNEKHHSLWTRREWSESPLPRRVRQMGAFLLDAPYPNHRLLHASLRPPEVPDRDTLLHMQELAVRGLHTVIENVNHPITEHLHRQLAIIAIDPDEAMYRIDTGNYTRH